MPVNWESSKPIPSWAGQAFSLLRMDVDREPLVEGETLAMRLASL